MAVCAAKCDDKRQRLVEKYCNKVPIYRDFRGVGVAAPTGVEPVFPD
jgi:hypothetical protein